LSARSLAELHAILQQRDILPVRGRLPRAVHKICGERVTLCHEKRRFHGHALDIRDGQIHDGR
jgi:hypothetical protein